MTFRTDEYLLLSRDASTTLQVGVARVLFSGGKVRAVFNGADVYFPDRPTTRAEARFINEFEPEVAHIRLPAVEWDFTVASTLLSQLRTLTRTPPKETEQ